MTSLEVEGTRKEEEEGEERVESAEEAEEMKEEALEEPRSCGRVM